VVDREAGFLVAEFDRALRWAWPDNRQQAVLVRHVAGLLRQRAVWGELVGRWVDEDERGDAAATLRMAWILLMRGDESESQEAFARAARRGNLSALSVEIHQRQQAGQDTIRFEKLRRRAETRQQRADRRADKKGDANAAYRIGDALIAQWEAHERRRRHSEPSLLFSTRGYGKASAILSAGKAALVRAAERGSADAAVRLGGLANDADPDDVDPDRKRDRARLALPWYRRADELGHATGSWWLGSVLHTLGDGDEAEMAYRRAEARGDPVAASSLGLLLSTRNHSPRDWVGAEAAYRRAADLGYTEDAYSRLANFLEDRQGLPGAEAAWQAAADRGEPRAALQLRRFYEQHPGMRPGT